MTLNTAQKKRYRSIGHHLEPVVIVSENGISEGLIKELNRALDDHELIKVKFALMDRDERREAMAALAEEVGAEVIQTIGKVALYLRRAKEQNKKLSNLVRYSEF